jgi:hypothetical protein
MKWKIVLRPVGLPVFLASLLFLPFFPIVTAAGAMFYGGAIYWAYQRERNKALPQGTVDEVGRLPYRRRQLANHAIAAARDIERRLALLPKDMAVRMPLRAEDAGRLAAAVVYYLREEGEARKMVSAGAGGEAEELAKKAGASAERTFSTMQELQSALMTLSLASAHVDREMLAAEAEDAVDEVKMLRQAMEDARAELRAAPGKPALEDGSDRREGGEGN